MMALDAIFYQPDTSPEANALAAAAWFDALAAFPQPAVAAAFREWMRTNKRRPVPADIRDLAVKQLASRQLALPAPPPPPEPERERVSPELAAQILAEAGFTPGRLASVMGGKRMPRTGEGVEP